MNEEKKVLIVDDDEGILDALSLILTDTGYIVSTTKKGDEVIRLVQTLQPDLILLDVLMSGHDGRHICKKLKSANATKHIPVVMISAHPSAGDTLQECGADAFLAKPFETKELMSVVSRFV